ncbi:hypothetical protein HYFRA_00013293 [Hymenoscyphus fraxineus]|uniref:AMP-dependent synthetase/ligase domain-containing protein n=1 Tax=Hymenoscyphus fraxineus TaxID=746836 RepID=A0A9N9Q0Z1_9HELO|nr:hypothetical protein HYFRA_00013293 [Hymenoscyphus fraxineus]
MPYKCNQTWEEGKDDPWIMFHTSGTTGLSLKFDMIVTFPEISVGLPKLITLTNKMMTVFDVTSTLPDADQATQASKNKDRRVYSPIPMFHQVGMVGALQGTVWRVATIVLGPSTKPPGPALSAQVLQFGQVQGFVGPPLLLKALCRDPASLELVRGLRFINWGGAPLEKAIGDLLKDYI